MKPFEIDQKKHQLNHTVEDLNRAFRILLKISRGFPDAILVGTEEELESVFRQLMSVVETLFERLNKL